MFRRSGATRRRHRTSRIRRRIGAVAVTLVAFASVAVAVAQPAEAGCGDIYLVNIALDFTVEVVNDPVFPGMLRATANGPGASKTIFTMCINASNDVFTLKSHLNNKYVSREEGYPAPYTNMLRARATTVGTWERFQLYETGSDIHGWTGSNGRWVTTRADFNGSDRWALTATEDFEGNLGLEGWNFGIWA